MPKFCVPLEKPKPDSDKFINVLMGKENTDKPPIFDFFVDDEVMRLIIEKLNQKNRSKNKHKQLGSAIQFPSSLSSGAKR